MEPFEIVPSISFFVQTVEQRLAANLGSLQHLLVICANLAFKDIRNQEFLRRKDFTSGLEGNLDDSALRIDLDEIQPDSRNVSGAYSGGASSRTGGESSRFIEATKSAHIE